jgi:hypothetical protein
MIAATTTRSPHALQHAVLLRRAGAVPSTAPVTFPALRSSVKRRCSASGKQFQITSPAIG